MDYRIIRIVKSALFLLLGLGLTAITIPHQCSREEAALLDQFQYLSKQEGFQKPKKGELTFYQTNGPVAGGSVSAMVSEEETVYAGIFGDGVYRKRASDDLWEPAGKGIKDPFILSLGRTRKGTFLAGSIRGGISISDDKGATWRTSNNGLTNLEVACIVEYGNEIFIGTGSGVFKSRDQGATWDPINKGMESTLVRAFVIDHSGTYFAGTGGQGIFVSADQGKKWSRVEFKLQGESGLNENYIRVLAQSPRKFLYAGTFGGGIFRSSDGGRRWLPVNTGLTNTSIRSLQILREGTLYAGTGEGVFSSNDEGESWQSRNGDLTDRNVQSMMVGSGRIYVGTASAVYRKKLDDTHWASLEKGITYPVVLSLTGDSERGFYAGTDGEGVFRSKDGGFSWFPMNEGLGDLTVRKILEDESHTLYLMTENGVYWGDRTRKSWILMNEGIGQKGIHALLPGPENNLYCGTEEGLFRRDKSSNYWEKVNFPAEISVRWLAGDQAEIFAFSDRQIYPILKGEPGPVPLALPPHRDEIRGAFFSKNLYLWTASEILQGSFRNHDLTWRSLPRPVEGSRIQTLQIESLDGKETLLAGTGNGAYWSSDQGLNWHPVRGKGADADVRSLFSPYRGVFLMGTGERGVLVGIGL